LTRSFFIGSHHHSYVWTADCNSSFKDLKQNISILLSLSISGFTTCGADIGGFFNDPN